MSWQSIPIPNAIVAMTTRKWESVVNNVVCFALLSLLYSSWTCQPDWISGGLEHHVVQWMNCQVKFWKKVNICVVSIVCAVHDNSWACDSLFLNSSHKWWKSFFYWGGLHYWIHYIQLHRWSWHYQFISHANDTCDIPSQCLCGRCGKCHDMNMWWQQTSYFTNS